jgi:hypothetical protein
LSFLVCSGVVEKAQHGGAVEIEHLRMRELAVADAVETSTSPSKRLPLGLRPRCRQSTTTSFSVAATTRGSIRRSASLGCSRYTPNQSWPGALLSSPTDPP